MTETVGRHGRRAHNLDLVCDGCGSTSSDVTLVQVEDPAGLITTCDCCKSNLRSEIVEEVDSNDLTGKS